MCRLRKKKSTLTLPEFCFVRTLQAPQHLVFNKATDRYEFSSAAFGPSSRDGSLSGDLEELLVCDGLDAFALYPSVNRGVGAAAFKIKDAREIGFDLGHEPVKANWYHGGVRGNFSKANRKKLQNIAKQVIAIDQKLAKLLEDQIKADAEKFSRSVSGY